MAKFLVFSSFDTKAEFYGPPMVLRSVAEAKRTFGDAAKNPQSYVFQHPSDYDLREIGTFDDQTGQFDSIVPKSHGLASSLVSFDANASAASPLSAVQ